MCIPFPVGYESERIGRCRPYFDRFLFFNISAGSRLRLAERSELQAAGTNVVVGTFDKLINWGRSNSLWPLTFATSCCGIEFVSLGAARFDMARFGWEVARSSPRQADLYDQLAEPKYVIACGACAVSGGPFKKSYHVVMGVDQIIPVDVYLPGCPPRPEAMIYSIMQLSRKIKVERFFGGVNRQEKQAEFLKEHPIEGVED